MCGLWASVVAALEKAMAPHSSTLAWKIPWTEEPGRLQPTGSWSVRHDWATSLSLFTFMHWRRKWQPTLVFLPGEFHGQRSLLGYSQRGRRESDPTELLNNNKVGHSFSSKDQVSFISWLQSPSAVILEQKNKVSHCFPWFPHLFASKWWDQMPWS